MRIVSFLIVLMLAACASPDRRYWGAEAQTVTIAGRDYAVYRRESGTRTHVQVIRLGYARRREHVEILGAMRVAAERATGCQVIEGSADGDSGVMNFRMRCPAT